MKSPFSLFILLTILAISGCSPSKLMTINSFPEEAEVYLDKKKIGQTPLEAKVTFTKKKDVMITLKKDLYKDCQDTLTYAPKSETEYYCEMKMRDAEEIELFELVPLQTTQGSRLQQRRVKSLAYYNFMEREGRVKSVTRVTDFVGRDIQVGEPWIAPTGKEIVFSIYEFDKDFGGQYFANVHRTPIGTSSKTRLTQGNRLEIFPSYSPDGKYIYVSSNRNTELSKITRFHSQGSGGITTITSGISEDFAPSTFSDGKSIVYTSNLPGALEPQIWTIQTSGTLPTQLKEGKMPHPNPEDDRIIFVRSDRSKVSFMTDLNQDTTWFNPEQLWTMSREGGEETQLTQNTDYNCRHPKWSPDGKWILFASNKGKNSYQLNNYDIWLMKSDGTQERQLTTNGSWDDFPCWSPDGTRVYFRSNRGGAWNIWYFDLEPHLLEED